MKMLLLRSKSKTNLIVTFLNLLIIANLLRRLQISPTHMLRAYANETALM